MVHNESGDILIDQIFPWFFFHLITFFEQKLIKIQQH